MADGRSDQSTERTRLAYDTVADDYARLLPDTRTETPLDLAMVDAFAERVRDAGDVLDAGCGAGRMSRYLADRGCAVRGVDLSPGMVQAPACSPRSCASSASAAPCWSGSRPGRAAPSSPRPTRGTVTRCN